VKVSGRGDFQNCNLEEIDMKKVFEIEAQARTDVGKGASRRLRRAGQVPAIVYGAGKDAQALTLNHNEMMTHLKHEAFYSHILALKIDGKKTNVVLKDLHRHPFKPRLLHADFLRVKAGEAITMNVPIHFIGEEECLGVKAGGKIQHTMSSIEIICLPKDLPEYLEIDVSNLEMDQSIHLSEIKLPEGVKIVALEQEGEHDTSVVSVHEIKESKEDLEADAAEAEAAAAAAAEAETAGGEAAEGEAKLEGEEGEAKPEGEE
jgi:large subunit ribosomal protein L25